MVISYSQAHMLTCNSPWQWMCNNGECIAQYDLCNGITQCTDGSDEIDCDKRQWQNKDINMPREENMKSAIKYEMDKVNPTINNTATAIFSTIQLNQWLIILIFILFTILLITIIVQYRRKRNRLIRSNRAYGVRKSLNMVQNDDDDEDDLLIGSLYS